MVACLFSVLKESQNAPGTTTKNSGFPHPTPSTNLKTGNSNDSPKPATLPDKSPREMIDEAMHNLLMENLAMRRILWLAAKQNGGHLTLDESRCDPLWRLKKSRPPKENHILILDADTMPPPEQAQLDLLVKRLAGSQSPISEATMGTPLADYASGILEMLIRRQLVRNADGYWTPAKQE